MMTPGPQETESCAKTLCGETSPNLMERLSRCESRLDALHADAAAHSATVSEFAAEVAERLVLLEARLTGGPMDSSATHELMSSAMAAFVADVKGCAQRLFTEAGTELEQVIEAGRAAAAEATASAKSAEITFNSVQGLHALDARVATLEAESQSHLESATPVEPVVASASIAICPHTHPAEARILERCVALIDAARSPANSAGLDALRDLVESVESVSARITALERKAVGKVNEQQFTIGTSIVQGPLDPQQSVESISESQETDKANPLARRDILNPRQEDATPTETTFIERLAVLESDVPAMRESMLVLWSTLREVSREVCCSGAQPNPNTTAILLETSGTQTIAEFAATSSPC